MRELGSISAILLLVAGCHHAKPRSPEPRLVAPAATTAIVADGEAKEPDWNARAARAVFVDDTGAEARPYSELRVLRDDRSLYLYLYAADEDIHHDEEFTVTLGATTYHFFADGTVSPSVPHGIDRDGTLDVPGDYDEEWVIEAALPLPKLPVSLSATRCDVTKSGEHRCGHVKTTLAP